jgi:hypothetical protein
MAEGKEAKVVEHIEMEVLLGLWERVRVAAWCMGDEARVKVRDALQALADEVDPREKAATGTAPSHKGPVKH